MMEKETACVGKFPESQYARKMVRRNKPAATSANQAQPEKESQRLDNITEFDN